MVLRGAGRRQPCTVLVRWLNGLTSPARHSPSQSTGASESIGSERLDPSSPPNGRTRERENRGLMISRADGSHVARIFSLVGESTDMAQL